MTQSTALIHVALAAALSGCASQTEASFTQADANALAEECGAPKGWVRVFNDGAVTFEPPIDADYDISACVLQGIKDAGVTKFGFVGNEKYVIPERK